MNASETINNTTASCIRIVKFMPDPPCVVCSLLCCCCLPVPLAW
uniref:Uncharacterized protein n=1 Tax=Arundo donax TaxID=35708 RepID=A0A0A9EFR4_ARUDO